MSAEPQSKRRRLVLSVGMATLCVYPQFGLAQGLLDIYQIARSQDAQYQIARKAFNAALEKLPQARAALLPTANLTANKNRQFGVASFSEAAYTDRDVQGATWGVQLTQPLLRWANWLGYEQADAATRQAAEQFSVAEQDLIVRVAQAYLDVLTADQSTKVMQAQLQAMAEQLALAERTYSVGSGTITDVYEAKTKWAQSRAQSVAASNELASKRAELEKIFGSSLPVVSVGLDKTAYRDSPELSTIQLDTWLSAATQNPQVRAQQAALEIARMEVRKNQAAHLPTLDLVLSRNGNYSSGSLSSPADLSTQVYSNQAGLQLNVPLFAGGATQSKVRESLALEEKAQDELTLMQRNVASQVRQAHAGVVNGQAQVAALQMAAEAGRNAVESNKIGFRIGTRINPDVLNAEQQLYVTLRDLSKARMETTMQGFKLKAAVGALTQEDLAQLDRLLDSQPQ